MLTRGTVETSIALQGDAQLGSPLPSLLAPVIALAAGSANVSSIKFNWNPAPGPRYDGISVLVNDVERYRGYFADFDEDSAERNEFVWERKAGLDINEYFRFAYMEGSQSDDYTKAGVWDKTGQWVEMAAGPSRVKSRSLDGEGRVAKMR